MKAKLSQRTLGNLGDGVYRDELTKGLYLVIKGGSRAWVLRRQVNGKRYDVGLGSAASIALANARAMTARLVGLGAEDFVKEIEASKKKKPMSVAKKTFRKVCDEYMQWNIDVGNWKELSKSHRVFESRMRCHVWPRIGDKIIDEIKPADVSEIAAAVWDKPDIVDRCLGFAKKVFDWAKAKGYTDRDNPADRHGALQFLLPNNRHVKQNRGALAVSELPDFFAASMAEKQISSRQCFEFSILTATRSQTAREARWDQIDWKEKIWTVPPEQLKVSNNGALIVPLAPKVIEFLKSIDRPHEGLIFPNRYGNVMTDTMLGRLVKLTPGDWTDRAESLKRGKTVRPTQHGIARATFMTWSQDDSLGNDKRFDVRVAHLCLHHKLNDGYNGAYERQTMFRRRRELMEAWADFCFSKVKTDGESK